MKIRSTFVSNSSSSSFMVFLKVDDKNHVPEAIQALYEESYHVYDDYEPEDFVNIDGVVVLKYKYSDIESYINKLQTGYKMFKFKIDSEESIDVNIMTILDTIKQNMNIEMNYEWEGY